MLLRASPLLITAALDTELLPPSLPPSLPSCQLVEGEGVLTGGGKGEGVSTGGGKEEGLTALGTVLGVSTPEMLPGSDMGAHGLMGATGTLLGPAAERQARWSVSLGTGWEGEEGEGEARRKGGRCGSASGCCRFGRCGGRVLPHRHDPTRTEPSDEEPAKESGRRPACSGLKWWNESRPSVGERAGQENVCWAAGGKNQGGQWKWIPEIR